MNQDNKDKAEVTKGPEYVMPDDSSGFALAERAAWHLLEIKGEDLVVMDMRGRSDVCDFLVLATGLSSLQVNALAKHVHNELLDAGQKAKGLEGMTDGRWALLDYFDVVVHVFHSSAREYFQLEKLWSDSPRLALDYEYFAAEDVAARHPAMKFNTAAGTGDAE
jgi:ribosome-associated protein